MKTNRILPALLIAAMTLTFAVSVSAQSGANMAAGRTIEVGGTGEARTSPDTAELSVAIETTGKTAEEAASRNAALAEKVTAALKAKLGDKGKISTGGYSLNPQYDQRPGHENPTIIGYTAQNSIVVETGAIDLVGALIDSAISAGANRVDYLNFTVKNDIKPRTEAITSATRDARAQADALASALGVKLGKVIKATTLAEARPIPMQRLPMAMAATRAATPVEPGEVTVSATVSLTFEIE
jgi:uncharacterized protein YggE